MLEKRQRAAVFENHKYIPIQGTLNILSDTRAAGRVRKDLSEDKICHTARSLKTEGGDICTRQIIFTLLQTSGLRVGSTEALWGNSYV